MNVEHLKRYDVLKRSLSVFNSFCGYIHSWHILIAFFSILLKQNEFHRNKQSIQFLFKHFFFQFVFIQNVKIHYRKTRTI